MNTFKSPIYFTLVAICLSSVAAKKTKLNKKNAACPPFPYPQLEHGNISESAGRYSFQCNSGYFLTSDRQVRCWKGRWSSDAQPRCLKAGGTCDDPPEIAGGGVLGSDRQVGSMVQYVCKQGFVMLGEGRRSCLPSGHWGGVTPACIDEFEPLQKIAERLKNKFVVKVGSHSTSSVVQGRLLDKDSRKEGLELVVLVDRSSSIDPVDFKIGVGFVKFLLQEFGVRNGNNTSGTRAAVITFGTKAEMLFNLENATISGPMAANTALDSLQPNGGGTNMEAAFVSVLAELSPTRTNAKKAIFMITDGEPNVVSDITSEDYADNLKKLDFEIFTVGIGKGINKKFLSSLASEPLFNHVFVLDKYSDLKSVMKMIQDSPPKPKPIGPERCGYVKNANHFLKPWLAVIYVGQRDASNATVLSLCSGTLICAQWVLTAASCFISQQAGNETPNDPDMVFLALGERNLMDDKDHQMNFYPEEVVLHPEYHPSVDLQNNLALIKLNGLVPLDRFRPACLPPTDQPVPLHMNLNLNASIAGWGLQPRPGNGRGINGGGTRLNRADTVVELAEQSECFPHGGTTEAGDAIFCAGHGLNTCMGDMGSPIIAVDPSTNHHHVLGVLNRRTDCAKGYNHYADLTQYVKWINDVTNKCHHAHYMT